MVMMLIIRSMAREPKVTVLSSFRSSTMSSTSSVDTGALFAAVFGGQLEELERLLATGVQVENVVDEYGDSLLHAAASGGNVEVVRLILDSEGGMRLLDRPNNDGKTPLHYAYSANVTAELLTRGADGNAVDNDLRTPLHLASLAGARDVVETLVKHGVELNNLDRYNRNAMHFAAGIKPEDQDVAILKLLLDGGASVSVQEGDITALHLATRSNWLEAANLLLDHGADVNVLDMDCRTVLLIAIQESFIDLVKLFVSYGAAVNKKEAVPLQDAMQRPEAVEVTKLLLEHGAVTQWNYEGELSALTVAAETGSFELFMVVLAHEDKSAITPEALSHSLISACSSRRGAEIVQYLLELGASTAVKSIQVGDTVLHKACMTGNAVLVKLLLAQGADPNAVNYSGYTTLHTACVNKDSDEVVQLLLDRGVDVNKEVAGITALVNASSSGAVKTVEKLLAYGADTTISREDGKTALHCACSQGAPEVVRLLLEHGVDPNLRDVSGNTPLHVAALEERSAVVKVLGQRGADVHARNEDGFTPLTMCVRWDKCEAMQFRQNPVYALETVYELMKFGAVYEDSPMNCPDIFQGMSTTRPGTEDDWILYSELVASVPICIRYWTAQREAGKPLAQIPSGVAGNGCSAVQNFLDQTICQ